MTIDPLTLACGNARGHGRERGVEEPLRGRRRARVPKSLAKTHPSNPASLRYAPPLKGSTSS